MAQPKDQPALCVIPDQCMLKPPVGTCRNDLKCICELDAKFETNCVFSNECLWKECTDEDSRRAFMKLWIDSCHEVGKSGLNLIPQRWAPYIHQDVAGPNSPAYQPPPEPTSSTRTSSVTSTAATATSLPATPKSTLHTTPSSTKTTISSNNSLIATPSSPTNSDIPSAAPQTIVATSKPLSPSAIGGIVAGILVLALLCSGLGFCFWKAREKAKEKNREVAILSDQVSGQGFQRYIDELMAESHGSNDTILRHDEGNLAERSGDVPAAGTERVVSQSSSVYSDDIARAL